MGTNRVNGVKPLFQDRSDDVIRAQLLQCAGTSAYVDAMLPLVVDKPLSLILEESDRVWSSLDREAVLQATRHHPRIGGDLSALREKDAKALSEAEQGGVSGATEHTLEALRDANLRYEERFGFIFIVCATGKSAEEMLALCNIRLSNPVSAEWRVARDELAKITRLRLEKLT